jgi:hypothetical protein
MGRRACPHARGEAVNIREARALDEALGRLSALESRLDNTPMVTRLAELEARIAELEQRKTLSLGAQKRA